MEEKTTEMPCDNPTNRSSTPAAAASSRQKLHVEHLHELCSNALEASLNSHQAKIAKAGLLAGDIDTWRDAIGTRPEGRLLETAASELTLSVLNACQAQYRNAFKGLRLVLELCLQSCHLSANLLDSAEWLRGDKDTNWSALSNDVDGPLGIRFSKAFNPELAVHTPAFRSIATTLYRELSECIHGNLPKRISLTDTIHFNQETLDLWLKKAEILTNVCHFSLSLRYLNELTPEAIRKLRSPIGDSLGHISIIRSKLEE